MKTRVLECCPLDLPTKEEEFLRNCYKELNTKENHCCSRFFFALSSVRHEGNFHYYMFTYDRYMD